MSILFFLNISRSLMLDELGALITEIRHNLRVKNENKNNKQLVYLSHVIEKIGVGYLTIGPG